MIILKTLQQHVTLPNETLIQIFANFNSELQKTFPTASICIVKDFASKVACNFMLVAECYVLNI